MHRIGKRLGYQQTKRHEPQHQAAEGREEDFDELPSEAVLAIQPVTKRKALAVPSAAHTCARKITAARIRAVNNE